MTASIDPSRFVASGLDVRQFSRKTLIDAPVEDVYAAFTNPEAFRNAFAPGGEEITANIDLAIGGRYEWLFDGKVGSNGCQILSYLPNRMISFSWNAPPEQAESREKRTWVVVETTPLVGGRTEVTLTHLGFGNELHWDETFEYFSRAWEYVLSRFRENIEGSGA